MSSFSPIIHHATSILCSNKGSMELSQLHRAVFRSFADITEDTFWYIIEGCARFTVVASRPRAEDAQSERIVVAETSLRLCKKYSQNECYQCQDLHLCKYFVYGNCRYGKGRKACKFSHNIQSKHNYPLLRECTLHELNEDDLFLLLLQNDPTLLPEVCAHYNKGTGLFGACTFMERCTKVHICQHFVQDACLFGPKCKRQHSIDEHSRRMLEERGLGGDLIHDLPYIYQNVHRLNLQTLQNEVISEPGLNPVAQTEKNEICLHFIRGKCKFQDQCVLVHFNLPYKWEVNDGKSWRDLRNMEEIERAFCDPKNEHSPGSRPVDLLSMTRNQDPVRRLSTVSSVSKPNHYILTTEWVWYYKGDHENWIEYGKPDDKQRVTSVTSRELEKAYVEDSTAEVTVIKGNRHYFVSFQDMYQRNPKHNTKRKVRRRPRFVSVNDVESKAAQ
ncbi:protein mono-ADP-ribosyltransferase PARP12b isoform X1 [Triplophysa rosa]|uniref:Poly ADP-ribose polymerase family n=1 Tax=Triplophysa rosa TaxID=992332 RepID=A0A9W7T595_TRIRA|nr:protein mono-ADP-ribosyltransferase PARP12b isoform X1 [Triplophysa rosa]KAI7791995.1 poly ADP-ribose polymerase family [Triplophysa rosa]